MYSLLELADKVEAGESERGFHIACELVREINEAGVSVTMGMIEGSIDAVEKLRAELLPDLKPFIEFHGYHWFCKLRNSPISEKEWAITLGEGKAKTEALARLAALLRAVHAETPDAFERSIKPEKREEKS